MLIVLETFAGHAINDGQDYQARYLTSNSLPAAKIAFLEQPRADSVEAGTYTVENRSVPISITILDPGARDTLVGQLKAWFKRGTEGDLVATFLDEDESYQLPCRVQNLIPDPDYPLHFTAMLVSSETAWRSVSVETDTWAVSGTGGTKTITVHGDDATRLSASFVATAAPSGLYLYQRLYQLINVPGFDYGKRAWCISLDTATLVAAGKMQADCDDLRLFDGKGHEFHRWIENKNTDHTHVWITIPIGPGYNLPLRTAIGSSGDIATIEFAKTAVVASCLKDIPGSGVLVHGTEWIHYASKDLVQYRLNVDQRGVFDTTLQAHNVADVFQYIQTPILISYGNPAATDPAANDAHYDDTKPALNLASSNNTTWVQDANSGFYDPVHPDRPGSWTKYTHCSWPVSKLFWVYEDAEIADTYIPALGMKLGCWCDERGFWQLASGILSWSLYCPGGFASVTAAANKYRSTNRWPAEAALQRSPNNINWYDVWNEATPASVSTWTTCDHASTAMATGTKFLRFCLEPSLAALADAYAILEATAVTVVFVTANLPTGSLGVEKSNYAIDIDLVNNENDDTVTLVYPMRLSTQNRTIAFVLDGENYRVTYDHHNAHQAMHLDDESRPVWLRLQPGANELEIDSPGVGTLSVALSWYRRHL